MRVIIPFLVTAMLCGCGGLNVDRMLPANLESIPHSVDASITVAVVAGGRKPTFGGPETVTNELFAAALTQSLSRSGVFKGNGDKGTPRLQLYATISRQSQDSYNLAYTGYLDVVYEIRNPQQRPLWKFAIPASHRVTVGEALSGAIRTSKAREGSVRANLASFIRHLTIWQAAADGQSEFVQMFLDAGASVDARDPSGNTSLMVAASNGQKRLVEMLLSTESAVNLVNQSGASALLAAARSGHRNIASTLLSHGADVLAVTASRDNALMLAASSGNVDLVRDLLNRNLDVNAVNEGGLSALLLAAIDENPEAIEVLLSAVRR